MFYVENPIENANYLRDLKRFVLFLQFEQILYANCGKYR